MAVYASTQRLFGIIQVDSAKKAETDGLIEILKHLIVLVYNIISRRIGMTGIKANAYAGLIFHPVDDMLQVPEFIADITALPGGVLNNRRNALRLAQCHIDGFGHPIQTSLNGNLVQVTARMKIQ